MRSTGFSSFDSLLSLATPVRGSLARSLRQEGAADREVRLLARAVEHVELIRAGLQLRIQAEGESRPEALLVAAEAGDGIALVVAGQATIVLALVPRLPRDLVTWPGLTGYTDVRVPASTVEALARMDELCSVLGRTADGARLDRGPDVRRSFAFFDTASWLSLTGARGFATSG